MRFDDARCSLWVQLTKDAYAVVKSTLVARATRHDHPSIGDPDYEPFERRLADAWSKSARNGGCQAAALSGGSSSGASEIEASFAGAGHVVVHADVSLFTEIELDREGPPPSRA